MTQEDDDPTLDPDVGPAPAVDPSRPWPGELRRLADRYVLEEPIASGGVAIVWRAYDEVLARSVAIKLLLPHVATDPTTVARFRREMVATAALAHPNLVAIYDTGQQGDLVYLVMEYVDGPSLKQVLRTTGPLDPLVAAALGEQIATGLGVVHAAGLIHRDVKPANVLLTRSGVAKITDFGIATAVDDTATSLTEEGKVVGTATYLAPEQLQGRTADPRVDVYSLGVVLYECLVGRPAFEGDTPTATASARLTREVVPPRQLRADVPRDLDAVIVRATRRDPGDRPPHGAALAEQLARIVPSDPIDLTATLIGGGGRAGAAVSDTVPDARDRGRSGVLRFMLAIAAGLAVAVGVLLIANALDADPVPPTPLSGPIQSILAASDFDPFGAPAEEHPDQVVLAHDGDLTTQWTTERYRGSAVFGGLKAGVGIWFDLGGSEPAILEVVLDLDRAGPMVELYSASQLPDPVDGIIGWGRPVLTTTADNAVTTLTLATQTTARYWLLWFTQLAATDDGLFQAGIREVRFVGPG